MTRDGAVRAMGDTVAFAKRAETFPQQLDIDGPCSLRHLIDMHAQMREPDFSENKTHRWLGWAQGVLVARGIATLDDVKEISKRYAETP